MCPRTHCVPIHQLLTRVPELRTRASRRIAFPCPPTSHAPSKARATRMLPASQHEELKSAHAHQHLHRRALAQVGLIAGAAPIESRHLPLLSLPSVCMCVTHVPACHLSSSQRSRTLLLTKRVPLNNGAASKQPLPRRRKDTQPSSSRLLPTAVGPLRVDMSLVHRGNRNCHKRNTVGIGRLLTAAALGPNQ